MLTNHHRSSALAAVLVLLAGFGLLVAAQQPATKTDKQEPKAEGKEPKNDAHGDPLPEGAILRLGTVRLRHGEPVSLVAFLQDGKALLTVSGDGIVRVWDVANGKE